MSMNVLLSAVETKALRKLIETQTKHVWQQISDDDLTAWAVECGVPAPQAWINKCHRLGIGEEAPSSVDILDTSDDDGERYSVGVVLNCGEIDPVDEFGNKPDAESYAKKTAERLGVDWGWVS